MLRPLTAACLAACLALPAQADVELTLKVEGYDDFFKRCDFDLDAQASAGIERVTTVFRVAVPGKGAEMCRATSNSRSCRDSDDFQYTCDDLESVDVLTISCTGPGDSAADCGTLSFGAPEGTSATATVPEMTGSADADVQVFAMILGDDGFFDACKTGFSYSAPPEVEKVIVDYTVPIADRGEKTCQADIGGNGGYGQSCSGTFGLEFTCADVTRIDVTAIACEGSDGPVDCGSTSLRGLDKGVWKDAR